MLSSLLTKVSRRASDTSDQALPRRIAAGYPARLFVRKTEELTQRLAEVAGQLALAPPASVEGGDARVLRGIEPGTVDLAVTSPPYPGVYDYLAHHEARIRWLRLVAVVLVLTSCGDSGQPAGPDTSTGGNNPPPPPPPVNEISRILDSIRVARNLPAIGGAIVTMTLDSGEEPWSDAATARFMNALEVSSCCRVIRAVA